MIDWTIKGRLLVKLPFTEFGTDNIKPLAGVSVKIFATKDEGLLGGVYNKWEEVVTDKDGFFIVTKRKNKQTRQFKAEIEFKDEDLKIYGDEAGLIRQWIDENTDDLPRISDHGVQEYVEAVYENISRLPYRVRTYEVYLGYGSQNNGFADFGNQVIDTASTNIYLNNQIMNAHASIWFLYKEIIKFLKNNDAGFDAASPYKIGVKYPHNIPINTKNFDNSNETSYSNPRNKIIFIVANGFRNDLTVNTLIHELMHFWMYLHCTGEIRITFQWLLHKGTHDQRQEKTFVAFHESFAEWAKNRLLEEVFGLTPSGTDNGKPFHREHLLSIGADSIDEIGHYEEAWTHFFNLLTVDNLHRFNLNPASPVDTHAEEITKSPLQRCGSPSVSFTGFLKIFKNIKGTKYENKIRESEMNIKDMLDRACTAVPELAGKKDIYLQLLDPQETKQPSEFFCENIKITPPVPFPRRKKTEV